MSLQQQSFATLFDHALQTLVIILHPLKGAPDTANVAGHGAVGTGMNPLQPGQRLAVGHLRGLQNAGTGPSVSQGPEPHLGTILMVKAVIKVDTVPSFRFISKVSASAEGTERR